MFIGYTPSYLQSLSISQSRIYLFKRFQATFSPPRLSVQELCRIVLQYFKPFQEEQSHDTHSEEGMKVIKKWSSLANSCEQIKIRKRDYQLEERVFSWFNSNNIKQSKCENLLKNKYLVRRASIALKAQKELTSQNTIMLNNRKNRFNVVFGNLSVAV